MGKIWLKLLQIDLEQEKFENLDVDIAFIKLCKKEQLLPTITKVNVSIQNGIYKLKRKIACLVRKQIFIGDSI